MIFPRLLRKLVFQRHFFFFLTQNMFREWDSHAYFFLISYYLLSHVGLQHGWSLEKNKQSKNSPLKQDIDTVTFTKWHFSSNYLMASTFRAKVWKLYSMVRLGLGETSFWKKKELKLNIFMNTLSNISAYQEVGQTKFIHCQAQLEKTSAALATATQPHMVCQSWASGQREAFPRCARAFVLQSQNTIFTWAMSVLAQNQGSTSCWYHLGSLAQHLLGQGEQRPSTRYKKPLMWVLHVNPLSIGNLWYSPK